MESSGCQRLKRNGSSPVPYKDNLYITPKILLRSDINKPSERHTHLREQFSDHICFLCLDSSFSRTTLQSAVYKCGPFPRQTYLISVSIQHTYLERTELRWGKILKHNKFFFTLILHQEGEEIFTTPSYLPPQVLQ